MTSGGAPATVIFACVHNAGRSQMAAAFFNALADPARARALSAGTDPGEHVHRAVRDVMREAGFDLSRAKPQRLTDEIAASGSLLVTMGCGESCPLIPGLERDEWNLPDPNGQPLEAVRAIRDDIRTRMESLVKDRGWERAAS